MKKTYTTFHGKILGFPWEIFTASKFPLYALTLKELEI